MTYDLERKTSYKFACSSSNCLLLSNYCWPIDKQGWGLTVVLGIHPTPRMLPLHPMELFTGRIIVASVFGGFKGKTQLPHFARECMKGVGNCWPFLVLLYIYITILSSRRRGSASCLSSGVNFQVVNLDEFITHELPFEKINDAFQLLTDGKSLRCLLHF